MSLTGIAQAFSTNYELFATFAFLNAVGVSGLFPLAFILGLEMVGKRKRGAAGIVCNYFYALGMALLGVVAWLYSNWVVLQLIISIPPMIMFVYYWIVPESVRWLMAKNRHEEAVEIIKEAARVNKCDLSEATLKSLDQGVKVEEGHNDKIWPAIKELLSSRVMLMRSSILLYNFAINALVYFGLSLNSVTLSGNKYFNFILVSLVEIPGYGLGYVVIEKFGRVFGFSASMILCGLTCILCGYADNVVLQISLFLIGKLGITCSFSIIYVHATEMVSDL
jgi:MFS transporter, OCT family, solute carrier family 22 (organic cation transporter), member 4/5